MFRENRQRGLLNEHTTTRARPTLNTIILLVNNSLRVSAVADEEGEVDVCLSDELIRNASVRG